MGNSFIPAVANLFTPVVANLFMQLLQIQELRAMKLNSQFKYVEDILVVGGHGIEKLNNFLKRIKSFHSSIQLTPYKEMVTRRSSRMGTCIMYKEGLIKMLTYLESRRIGQKISLKNTKTYIGKIRYTRKNIRDEEYVSI